MDSSCQQLWWGGKKRQLVSSSIFLSSFFSLFFPLVLFSYLSSFRWLSPSSCAYANAGINHYANVTVNHYANVTVPPHKTGGTAAYKDLSSSLLSCSLCPFMYLIFQFIFKSTLLVNYIFYSYYYFLPLDCLFHLFISCFFHHYCFIMTEQTVL